MSTRCRGPCSAGAAVSSTDFPESGTRGSTGGPCPAASASGNRVSGVVREGWAGVRAAMAWSTCPSPLPFPPPSPDSMPPDHERNFGFTQFALELNELTAELKRSLPSTDTRLRPDQRSVSGRPHPGASGLLPLPHKLTHRVLPSGRCLREMGPVWGQGWAGHRGLGLGGAVPLTAVWTPRYLEEGNIQAAEAQKRRIEQLQRDRRRVMEENNIVHQARFFRYLCPLPGASASQAPLHLPYSPFSL